MSKLIHSVLKTWAKIGIAPGYLYQTVDQLKSNDKEKKIAHLVGGNIMECDLNDHVQKQVYFFGSYEPIESYLFAKLIHKDSIVLDIGANVGYYSLILSNQIETGKVYAFEAVPRTYEKLLNNLKKSNKLDRVKAFNLGAWDKEETVMFHLPHSDNIGTFTAGNVENKNTSETIKAKMITIDQFIENEKIARIDFIKMDIEGAELKALTGAMKTLEQFHPTILLEVCEQTCQQFQYSTKELWDLLRPLGYRAFKIGHNPSASGEIFNFDGIIQSNVILTTKDLSTPLTNWNYKAIKAHFAQTIKILD